MKSHVCVIGLDAPEIQQLAERIDRPLLGCETLPKIIVQGDSLFVESPHDWQMKRVSHVVFHGVFADDFDLITALALWDGPCLPQATAMMDCRLKFPCLVRALKHTRFGTATRGYVSPQADFVTKTEKVAKWGNWHCGENKARFSGRWQSDEPCIIEPFFSGTAVRVVLIGPQAWQIRLAGESWLQSIHHPTAELMEIDPELLSDTQTLGTALGLEVLGNDYLITDAGEKHLLEVNHIPNVIRFPELWHGYMEYVQSWLHNYPS